MEKVIVIQDKPTAITLPYLDGKGSSRMHAFLPGENRICKSIWDAVVKNNTKRLENLGCLRKLDIPVPSTNVEVIDISTIGNVDNVLELITNTMLESVLDDYLKVEKKRDKPRKKVMTAIEAQRKELAK